MVPILTQDELDFVSHSELQTERIGMRLAQCCRAGDLFCLEGDLGSGKTCLARGIGRGLGVTEAITSPTFILINEHRLPRSHLCFYHIDLYRLKSPQEALALGLEEYLSGQGVCVIEWAERVREVLPVENLWITLRHVNENKRSLTITAHGARYQELLAQLRSQAFGLET